MAKLHLVNDIPYVATMCGLDLDSVGEDWTDSLVEVIDGYDDMPPVCPKCLKAAKRVVSARHDRSWEHEVAVEAGMLHGIEAYNEVMGWD